MLVFFWCVCMVMFFGVVLGVVFVVWLGVFGGSGDGFGGVW